MRALTNGVFVPVVEVAETLIHPQRALGEPALHVALFEERAVAEFRVVAREREVAEGVQLGLLDALPLRAKFRPPL